MTTFTKGSEYIGITYYLTSDNQYLILKHDKHYNVYKQREEAYTMDEISTFYDYLSSKYNQIWSGLDKLKDAKEYILELY